MSTQRAHTPAYGEVDLTTCDREPIHIPGAIQPHGVLLALDDELRAVMVSANVASLLDVTADDALGRTLAELVGPDLAARSPTGAGDRASWAGRGRRTAAPVGGAAGGRARAAQQGRRPG